MAKSNIISKPKLSGSLVNVGAWNALLARSGYRIYPYQVGCMVRADSNTSIIETHGLGNLAVDDYVVFATPVEYGESPLFIPDMSKIRRVGSFGSDLNSDPTLADDDIVNLTYPIATVAGDYIFCLGPDTGLQITPNSPNFDGSSVTVYSDSVGNEVSPNPYLLTGQGGWFNGWLLRGTFVVDLLITDSGNKPVVILPTKAVGPEVI